MIFEDSPLGKVAPINTADDEKLGKSGVLTEIGQLRGTRREEFVSRSLDLPEGPVP